MARRRRKRRRRPKRFRFQGIAPTGRSRRFLVAVVPLAIWVFGLLTGAVTVETPLGRAFVTGVLVLVGLRLLQVSWPRWVEVGVFGVALVVALMSLTALGGEAFFPYAVAMLFFGVLGSSWLARFRDQEIAERDAWKKSVARPSRKRR